MGTIQNHDRRKDTKCAKDQYYSGTVGISQSSTRFDWYISVDVLGIHQ